MLPASRQAVAISYGKAPYRLRKATSYKSTIREGEEFDGRK